MSQTPTTFESNYPRTRFDIKQKRGPLTDAERRTRIFATVAVVVMAVPVGCLGSCFMLFGSEGGHTVDWTMPSLIFFSVLVLLIYLIWRRR